MDMTNKHLQTVREIILNSLKGHDVTVYFFGSRANGTASSKSDIDIAVSIHTELPTGLLSSIRENLKQSNVPYTVDLVDLATSSSDFRCIVEEKGIIWKQ